MIKAEYRTDMGKNYLTIENETEPEDGYFLRLLMNNKIEGLLPVELRVIDGRRECCYDVTGKQPLKGIFERGAVDLEQLKEILEGIKAAVKRGEEYLLQPEGYVLEPDTIFVDLKDFSLFLCYLPGYRIPMEEKWKAFTGYLMNAVDYRKEETVLYVYSLYKNARQGDGFWQESFCSPEEIRPSREMDDRKGRDEGQMDEISTGKESREKSLGRRQIRTCIPEFEERIEEEMEVEVYPVRCYVSAAFTMALGAGGVAAVLFLWRPGPVQAGILLLLTSGIIIYRLAELFSPERKETRLEKQVEFIPAKEEAEGREPAFTWESQSEEEEHTAILAMEESTSCFLRAEDSRRYQDIELIEFPFFFGKLRTQVNSLIESPAVSRFHAKIEHLGGEYYLVDLNSTNGTYLNGERLKSHERRKLTARDKVRFADVGYYFEEGQEE